MNIQAVDIENVETSILVEYIHNYILESVNKLNDDIDYMVEMLPRITVNDVNKVFYSYIVKPYKELWQDLGNNVAHKIINHFDLNVSDVMLPESDDSVYLGNFNFSLMEEYVGTERISEVVEKLTEKALDVSVLSRMGRPLIRKAIDSTSPGSNLLKLSSFDADNHRSRHSQEILKILKGISKNISTRMKNRLIRYYTEYVYNIAEEEQINRAYEQVI